MPNKKAMDRNEHVILNQYLLGELLSNPSADPAVPDLYKGLDPKTGSNVLIKVWSRAKNTLDDLGIIWRNEILLLQRLAGYPGGREYLVPMLDAGTDEKGFYLILKSGHLLPLPCINKQLQSNQFQSRENFWKNAKRLAKGLGILHAHGLIHRNLDEWGILTNGNEREADYKLSGFEWSIRLRSEGAGRVLLYKKGDGKNQNFSFNDDWQSFGRLVAKLLGVRAENIENGIKADEENISFEEYFFLRDLISPRKGGSYATDSELVIKSIDKIIREQQLRNNESDQKYLAFVYNNKTQDFLWNGLLDLDGEYEHVDYLLDDISEATLVKLKQQKPRPDQYAISGNNFTYYLKDFNNRGDWIFATIDNISNDKNYYSRIKSKVPLQKDQIQILDPLSAARIPLSSLSRVQSWSRMFEDAEDNLYPNTDASSRYDAFVLLHLIESIYQAAMTWRVVVRNVVADKNKNRYTVNIKEENERRKLSDILGLTNSQHDRSKLLKETIYKLRDNSTEDWHVIEGDQATTKNDSDTWEYIKFEENGSDIYFHFRGSQYFSEGQILYLRSGDDSQERRQTHLIKILKEHAELTEVLTDPISSTRKSHDPEPSLNYDLDESKEKVLKDVFKTLPIYLLQGPPGVGKTYLIAALVKECFSIDPTTRILITAQGHDAVNHIMSEICANIESWQGNIRECKLNCVTAL